MKPTKIILSIFLITIFAVTLPNIGFTLAGFQSDPTGDASGINACDISRVDVDVTYHSPPVDDVVILKITLLEAPLMDENHTIRYDYNFWIDTSLSSEPDTTTWSTDVFEYIAHLDCRWVSDAWLNTSYLLANRYYLTGDGSAKVMGSFYWNPNTDVWQASNPNLEVGQVIGSSIVWDVTSAIFREQPIGTGYVIQGVANANYGFSLKDIGPNSGWCDEFDGMCSLPSSTGTPTLSSIGIIYGLLSLSFIIASIYILKRKIH